MVLPEETVNQIIGNSENDPTYKLTIDLDAQRVWDEDEEIVADFDIEPFRRHCLLNGLDDIGLTLEDENDILDFESKRSEHGGILSF